MHKTWLQVAGHLQVPPRARCVVQEGAEVRAPGRAGAPALLGARQPGTSPPLPPPCKQIAGRQQSNPPRGRRGIAVTPALPQTTVPPRPGSGEAGVMVSGSPFTPRLRPPGPRPGLPGPPPLRCAARSGALPRTATGRSGLSASPERSARRPAPASGLAAAACPPPGRPPPALCLGPRPASAVPPQPLILASIYRGQPQPGRRRAGARGKAGLPRPEENKKFKRRTYLKWSLQQPKYKQLLFGEV